MKGYAGESIKPVLEDMSDKTKTFVKGAVILGIIGVICKIIGAVFRIPLANIIGTQGIAYYQMVYPIYALLLVISTAGLPAAIAKMVSERRAVEDYKGAKEVFTVSLRLLLIIGAVSTVLMFAVSRPLASLLGLPDANVAFMAIAPALFFVAIISSYRGYFQGMQMMAPTGFSQLVEQLIKLAAGLWIAKKLLVFGPQYAGAGALIGVSISEVLALVLLLIIYGVKKRQIYAECDQTVEPAVHEPRKVVLKKLLVIAIPVTLGACIMPIVMSIDTAVVVRGLMSVGFAREVAAEKFALLTGFVNPLINMPAVLSLALAMSLVPAISAFNAKGLKDELKEQSGLGFKMALLVGLPAAAGFGILAKPIISLLYRNLEGAVLNEAAVLLIIMAAAVLVLTMVQTMTGILQGLGRVLIPVRNLGIGALAKIVISVVLIRIPEINVKGAAIGTVSCYAIAAILNIISVSRHTKMRIDWMGQILKPVIATALMGGAVYFAYPVLEGILGSSIATLGAIVIGLVVYAAALLLTKTITKDEIAMIRGRKRTAS